MQFYQGISNSSDYEKRAMIATDQGVLKQIKWVLEGGRIYHRFTQTNDFRQRNMKIELETFEKHADKRGV